MGGIAPDVTASDAATTDHRGFADESEYPGLSEFVILTFAAAKPSVFHASGEAVHDHRITMTVDDVLNFTDHASQPHRGQPARSP